MDVQVINVEEGTGHRATTNDGDAEPSEGEVNNAENSGSHVEDGILEPFVGMEFDSEDAVRTFYNEYAKRVGFTTKVGQHGRSKVDGQSCIGSTSVARKEHSHSMVNPGKVHHLRPRKHFSSVGKTMPETYQGVGLVPSGVMYVSMDGNCAANENIREAKNTPLESSHAVRNSTMMNNTGRPPIRKRTLGRDAQNLLEYFKKMQAENPGFFYAIQLDEENLSPNRGFESSFFDGYVNQQTTLPMFFREYERALENWFEKEIEADFETICTTPVLKTPSPMEKQAASLFTRKIFSLFQEELVETFVYTANRIEGDEEAIRYAEEGAVAVETYNAAFNALKEGGKKIAAVKKSVSKVAPPSNKSGGTAYDDKKSSTSTSDTTPLLWPQHDEILRRFNLNDAGAPVQSVADLNLPRMAPVSLQRDDGPSDSMVVLPHLKSMTWVMENKNSTPGNKVAVINLKLQDYSRTPSAESEVKFQLSRVSLEPMLKSMAYISEQLSTPVNKVAVINLKLQDTETTSGESEVKFQVSRDTLGAMLRSMAYIREQLSHAGDTQSEPVWKRHRK
ncbi:hypothetical protein K1719_035657 [Acacia pycnantha]|nr:hypothetical protein K1719_035657 [Acacia pycnantha]